MPDKLTDSEIVKALECLEKDTNCGDCAFKMQCKGDCVFTKCLDLINRLQARVEKAEKVEHFADKTIATLQTENDRLKADCENYKQVAENQQKATLDKGFEIKRLKAENERLKEKAEKCFYCTEQANKKINEIKAEAYKEFAEKAKNKFFKIRYCESYYCVVDIDDLDNLLKELIGE